MNLEIYTLSALALVILILFIWVIWLQNKLGKLLIGKSKNIDASSDLLDKEIALHRGALASLDQIICGPVPNQALRVVCGIVRLFLRK